MNFAIQTITQFINENTTASTTINLASYPGAIDFSIINTSPTDGTGSNVTPIFNGSSAQILQPGDSMLSMGGYENCVRRDIVGFSFGAGIKSAQIYINVRIEEIQCLI